MADPARQSLLANLSTYRHGIGAIDGHGKNATARLRASNNCVNTATAGDWLAPDVSRPSRQPSTEFDLGMEATDNAAPLCGKYFDLAGNASTGETTAR
jgi:hypothetical protein